jgi:hypothetical protein
MVIGTIGMYFYLGLPGFFYFNLLAASGVILNAFGVWKKRKQLQDMKEKKALNS